jgi:1,2-diacylglycerol 3-beta-galactosyltransferase
MISTLTLDAFRCLFAEHPADIYISTHSALNHAMTYAWPRVAPTWHVKPLFCTVVTDLNTIPPIWFSPSIDLYFVPTRQAHEAALRAGILNKRVHRYQFPVPDRFFATTSTPRAILRQKLGLHCNKDVVLIVGGHDGSGPIQETVRQLCKADKDFSVVVVTGTNSRLLRKIQRVRWPKDVLVFGSVIDMNILLQAANVFITKAGTASLCEGAARGVPMVIFHELPGQEAGNARMLIKSGAAVLATQPVVAAREAVKIMNSPTLRQSMTTAATQSIDRYAGEQICRNLLISLAIRAGQSVSRKAASNDE